MKFYPICFWIFVLLLGGVSARADEMCPNRRPKPTVVPASTSADATLLRRIVLANLGRAEGRTTQLGLNCWVKISEAANGNYVGNFFYPTGALNHTRERDVALNETWQVSEATHSLEYGPAGLRLTYDADTLRLENLTEVGAAESCALVR